MEYRPISFCDTPREAQFAYFRDMANPYVGLTAEVDVRALLDACHARRQSFSLALIYCLGRAANAVPALRQRIVDGQPVEYTACDTSHTVLRADGGYGYCRLNPMQPFADFLPEAQRRHALAKQSGGLDDGEDAAGLLFLSAIPWVHYTALTQPTPFPADSNPRITWGKYEARGAAVSLPVTLLANHALVDGAQLGQFYAALGAELAQLSGAADESAP